MVPSPSTQYPDGPRCLTVSARGKENLEASQKAKGKNQKAKVKKGERIKDKWIKKM